MEAATYPSRQRVGDVDEGMSDESGVMLEFLWGRMEDSVDLDSPSFCCGYDLAWTAHAACTNHGELSANACQARFAHETVNRMLSAYAASHPAHRNRVHDNHVGASSGNASGASSYSWTSSLSTSPSHLRVETEELQLWRTNDDFNLFGGLDCLRQHLRVDTDELQWCRSKDPARRCGQQDHLRHHQSRFAAIAWLPEHPGDGV